MLPALSPATLARRALAFFAPQPAYAAFLAGSVGGAVSELSPSAVIDMQQVVIAYADSIANGTNTKPLTMVDGGPVRVNVTTKGGTALPDVDVTLSVYGNSSVIAFFSVNGGPDSVTVTRKTNALGVASFDGVSLTKAGGYRLVATGSFDKVDGQAVISNSFNIQNK
jgi:hypothetical protein